jgi:hypothetical protein
MADRMAAPFLAAPHPLVCIQQQHRYKGLVPKHQTLRCGSFRPSSPAGATISLRMARKESGGADFDATAPTIQANLELVQVDSCIPALRLLRPGGKAGISPWRRWVAQ